MRMSSFCTKSQLLLTEQYDNTSVDLFKLKLFFKKFTTLILHSTPFLQNHAQFRST